MLQQLPFFLFHCLVVIDLARCIRKLQCSRFCNFNDLHFGAGHNGTFNA